MKIPATVITGFLGAGKTSLIRHLLREAGGARLAIVINEFGDLGIDRELLLGCGDGQCREGDVIELANGCICCTVADEFLPTMAKLLARDEAPDHILIETSGLALPKPLLKAFDWPDVRARVTVDGVIAVVDAPAVAEGRFAEGAEAPPGADGTTQLEHESPLRELFEDQLSSADMIVLNKTDGLSQEQLAAVRAEVLTQVRPQTKVLSAVHGALAPRVVLGLAAGAEDDLASRPSHHDDPEDDHDHDEFVSFVASVGAVRDPAMFDERIRRVAADHDVLRVKGFVAVEGKAMRHVVQAVGGRVQRYYDRPWRAGERRGGELVVIGPRGLDRAAITRALLGDGA